MRLKLNEDSNYYPISSNIDRRTVGRLLDDKILSTNDNRSFYINPMNRSVMKIATSIGLSASQVSSIYISTDYVSMRSKVDDKNINYPTKVSLLYSTDYMDKNTANKFLSLLSSL